MLGIWKFRGLIFSSVTREFQARYRGSLLGIAWTILNPLAMILVYTLIFSEIMKARLADSSVPFAYSIYLISGVITWGLFSDTIMRGQSVFLDNANYLKKVNVPKLCFPIISLCNALVNFGIVFCLFLLFLALIGHFPANTLWAFGLVLILQIGLSFGLALFLGVLNVFFRDVGQFIGVLLQFWFWLTPIVYSASILPSWVEPYMACNPMAPIISAYQHLFLQNTIPPWHLLLPSIIFAIGINGLAWMIYRRCSNEIVDEL